MSAAQYHVVDRLMKPRQYVRQLRQVAPFTQALSWTDNPAEAGRWSMNRADAIARRNKGYSISVEVTSDVPA